MEDGQGRDTMANRIIYPEDQCWVNESNPTDNHEASSIARHIRCGANSGNERRGFLKWTTADLPANGTLNSAILVLFHGTYKGTLPQEHIIDIRHVTADWDRGQCTWNERLTGTNWATPGGDYYGSAEFQFISIEDPYTLPEIIEIDITSLVQDWIDSTTTNYGIIFVQNSITGSNTFQDRFKNTFNDEPSYLRVDEDAAPAVERYYRPSWISPRKWKFVTGADENTITIPRNPTSVRVTPNIDLMINRTIGRNEIRVARDVDGKNRRVNRRMFVLTFPPDKRHLLMEWQRLVSLGRRVIIYPGDMYDVTEEADKEECWNDGSDTTVWYLPHRQIRDDGDADSVRIFVSGVEQTGNIDSIDYVDGKVTLNYDPGDVLVEAMYQVRWVCVPRGVNPGFNSGYRVGIDDHIYSPIIVTLEESE